MSLAKPGFGVGFVYLFFFNFLWLKTASTEVCFSFLTT